MLSTNKSKGRRIIRDIRNRFRKEEEEVAPGRRNTEVLTTVATNATPSKIRTYGNK